MNQNQFLVSKRVGETPLEIIDRLRKDKPELKEKKMTYAGRLDPMAEGLLLILAGDEIKNKEKYLGLDKEYEVEILFGFSSDTGDVLGLVEGVNAMGLSSSHSYKILQDFIGIKTQKYPMYSSKTVEGKQLHEWARSGGLDEDKIPEQEVEIYRTENLGLEEKTGEEILKTILEKIDLVKGDFRQKEIKEKWQEVLSDKQKEKFHILKIKVSCSSGTYMRVLAEEIGKKLNTKALAYSINRTRLGEFKI